MTEPLFITDAPLEPGMDYTFLRQKGIELIQKLAGTTWTDYNAHDPGITILEALCYAITDLGYRLSFRIEDLLAFPSGQENSAVLFPTAGEILTGSPLTLNDYRKLLLDIDIGDKRAFKNAWLEPIENPDSLLYYDADNGKLTFRQGDSPIFLNSVPLRGLYRVLLEKEDDIAFSNERLIAEVKKTLHRHRNLCEDFAEIKILATETITVKAEIEIADRFDPNELIVQIYQALDRAISPSIEFSDLPELLARNIPVEELFTGPRLAHGFILDEDLEKFQRKTELRVSDLIRAIMDLPGVTTVRSITIPSDSITSLTDSRNWVFPLDPSKTQRLTGSEISLYKGGIVCYKGGLACWIDENLKKMKKTESVNPTKKTGDLPVPAGTYRELSDYETIQAEFPMVYGIGELGTPPSGSPERKARAKQLQAYLLVFDRILANYFTQLDRLLDLFRLGNPDLETYFSASIADFPGAREIFKNTEKTSLEKPPKIATTDGDRKNRLLDHLVAGFGETFIDNSLLDLDADRAIQRKIDFTGDLARGNSNRDGNRFECDRAVNYTLTPDSPTNIAAIKRRIARLLGIQFDKDLSDSDRNTENFYLLEHLLLRPVNPADYADQNSDVLSFAKAIERFDPATKSGADRVTCLSPKHGLKTGDRINIIYSEHYNGSYLVQDTDENSFEIPSRFVADNVTKNSPKKSTDNYQGQWFKDDRYLDPFSFQISVVLPDWPTRFANPNFQKLLRDTLVAEIPAHLTLYIHGLDPKQMRDFEVNYARLPEMIAGDPDARLIRGKLIELLEIGSADIPRIPPRIGYMVIGTENETGGYNSEGDPFFVIAREETDLAS